VKARGNNTRRDGEGRGRECVRGVERQTQRIRREEKAERKEQRAKSRGCGELTPLDRLGGAFV
jgi:hypothetical protein